MAVRRVTFAIYTRIRATVTPIFYISVRYHKSIKQKTAEPASDKFSCDSVEPPAANLICASSALSSSLQSAPVVRQSPFFMQIFPRHTWQPGSFARVTWELCITINLKAVNQYLNHLPECAKNLHPGTVLTRFLKLTNSFFFWCNLLFFSRKWWGAMINNNVKLDNYSLNNLRRRLRYSGSQSVTIIIKIYYAKEYFEVRNGKPN